MHIDISITDQLLTLTNGEQFSYPISSAKNGIGMKEDSFKTPIGNFVICEKIGAGAPIYTIFKGREAQGIWHPADHSDDDMITSRILWLDGVDSENANTKNRYIYIHGTNHEDKIGVPESCGCIRMRNQDIIELFEKTSIGSTVNIAL